MREFHAFAPFGAEHLAVTLTVPDGPAEPRGLLLLMTGLGAHRSHRFAIWTRTARALADRGIASARFEYLGVGESTGTLGEWPMIQVPVEQAEAVMRFAMRATGVTRVAAAGNCAGAWTALLLGAKMSECVGVGFIRAPILAGGMGALAKRARTSRLAGLVRKTPALRKAAVAVVAKASRPHLDFPPAYRAVLDRGRVLLLFGEEDYTFNDRARGQLDALRSRLSPRQVERLEVQVAWSRSLQGFDSLDAQAFVVDTMVAWATAVFATPSAASGTDTERTSA